MSVNFKCPLCDGKLEILSSLPGQETAYICKCIECGEEIPVDKSLIS